MKNDSPICSPQKIILGLMIRSGIYAVFIGIIAFGVLWGATQFGKQFYAETGPVEIMETVFALVTALVFLSVGRLDRQKESFVALMASLLFCAVIRESDYFLDVLVGRNTWKVLVGLLVVLTFFHVRRNFQSILESLMDFLSQPSFGILISGALVLVVFSRLFGYGDFWKDLIEGKLYRVVKTIVEEGVELMGYFLILVSSWEYRCAVRMRVRKVVECED